ncbi:NAD dependent epimerase/dehydratase family protein [Posidoniimonas polymericola]|uniref:NAD dependent epimerase/dehydratase family protein n=1 Tax=Posidoniimonas polymericola TaxID=2528002 RepID=A0A5C5ZDM7_9BACT|nr:NAD(P)-binding oxidoreductase [Posidoniimonas polymericola]TWT85265.1 NAD dependent epimerase/dehydratase family protein [Posidoniimonas polymericola]
MTILVLGATGATGELLVAQLLGRGEEVRAVVRSPDRLQLELRQCVNLSYTTASLLDLSDERLQELTAGCDAVASCLGHNLTLRGVFGQPRRLVTDAVRRVCRAIEANQPERPVKFVLMSSAGVRNRDLDEPLTTGERAVLALLRTLVPPHADNEQAADYLRTQVGQSSKFIEWCAVRPDSLTHADEVSPCTLHESPTRSALFNPGRTSRINVGHAMTRLIVDDELWTNWRGRMPVVYNAE